MSMRTVAGGVLRWFRGETPGTLLYLDANREEAALPVGTDDQVLTVVAGAPAWADASGGGCTPEILVDDVSGEILFDDVTGDILYDDSACVGGGSGCDCESGQDTAAATLYVNGSTGDDTTGDGSSGAPYATFAKAKSVLPRSIGYVQTIDLADATYPEAIVLEDFVCTGAGKIVVTGNTTTPANVVFTGTVTRTASDGVSRTYVASILGPVWVELEGIGSNPTTVDTAVWADEGARLIIDRCDFTGTTIQRGIVADNGARLELQHPINISNVNSKGIVLLRGSRGTSSTAGTLAISGTGGTAIGFQVTSGSSYAAFANQASGMDITVTDVLGGFQIGLSSSFTHQSPSATVTVDNASTPGSSFGVQCTDNSNWSMNGTGATLVLDHLTNSAVINSESFAEIIGTKTFTNTGAASVIDGSVNGF